MQGPSVAVAIVLTLALVAAILVLVFWFVRRVLRAQVVTPPPGTPVVSREQLVARLMALDAPGQPWHVRAGPEADLVVEWKIADAAWWGVMAKQGLRESYRLRLYLDDAAHRVGALDETTTLDWSAGLGAGPRLTFAATAFRGVEIARKKREIAFGFDTPAGGGAGRKLDVAFDLEALKAPVIAAVTAAGWTFAPVLRPQR